MALLLFFGLIVGIVLAVSLEHILYGVWVRRQSIEERRSRLCEDTMRTGRKPTPKDYKFYGVPSNINQGGYI